MALKVQTVDIWAATIKDKPGGLSTKLEALAEAGAQIEFVIARRRGEKPGTGLVFLTPLKGAKQLSAARKAGFRTATGLRGLKVEGADRPGLGAGITAAVAEQGVNLRGLSAAVIGRKFVAHLAFDKVADVTKAARVIRKL